MKIDRLFIDSDLTMDSEIEFLLSRVRVPPERVDDIKAVFDYINSADDPISLAKKTLHITSNKGAVIRQCPGTAHYTCCDYTILHTATFCHMDCSYCILQAYFHPPVLQYFAGIDRLKAQLQSVFNTNKRLRIGTGEYTDSLIWEPVSLIPQVLVEQFAAQRTCVLELKTKTVNISSLLDLDHNQKTILAWSLNTPRIIRHQEKGTASFDARLSAARKAQEKGYRLAFHFDPLVLYPGCELEYQEVIKTLFETIHPHTIAWISLGTFRFMPSLKQIIETRFPDSTICYGEFIQGLDNKMRYFKPLRTELYRAVIDQIRIFAPDVLLYFCMEDETVWRECLGFFPGKEGSLGRLLDKSAADICGLEQD